MLWGKLERLQEKKGRLLKLPRTTVVEKELLKLTTEEKKIMELLWK